MELQKQPKYQRCVHVRSTSIWYTIFLDPTLVLIFSFNQSILTIRSLIFSRNRYLLTFSPATAKLFSTSDCILPMKKWECEILYLRYQRTNSWQDLLDLSNYSYVTNFSLVKFLVGHDPSICPFVCFSLLLFRESLAIPNSRSKSFIDGMLLDKATITIHPHCTK